MSKFTDFLIEKKSKACAICGKEATKKIHIRTHKTAREVEGTIDACKSCYSQVVKKAR